MKHSEVPGIISEIGFDFDYNVEKLWQLDLPIEEISIDKLEWLLDIPFWWQNGGKYNLSPNTVLNNPEKYERKYNKILNADLSYPINIMFWKNRWMILDGLHRLSLMKLKGIRNIKVRKSTKEIIPYIRID